MLRSPLAIFGEYRLTVVAMISLLATGLWLTAAVAAAAFQVQEASESWWERFVPVVYLEAGIEAGEVDSLREEIAGWAGVSAVEVESASQALLRLQEQLGAEEVKTMGVTEAMMPVSLIVEPEMWRPGQVEVVARVEALEMRDIVVGVDAPEAGALRWIRDGYGIALIFFVVVVLGLVGALFALGALLRRLQEKERMENHLLEVFGASSGGLRRPTLFRGITIGAIAGALSGVAFLPWSLSLDRFVTTIAGTGALPDIMTAIWAVALLPTGVVIGAVVGWVSGRRSRRNTPGKMEGLLDWEREI